jgi:hypothetical protein
MSPEQITALTSLLSLMDKMSGWPFGLLFFLIIVGPWVLALMLAYSYRRRFESVVEMYEKNVRLVERYEKVSTDLKDVIMLNSQTFAGLKAAIETNQYCPMVRLEKKAAGRQV